MHSSIGFAVTHNTVLTFRGTFAEFDAKLADGRLEGSAQVASSVVDDENLAGHLQTPRLLRRRAVPGAALRLELDRARGRRARLARGRADDQGRHGAVVELAGTISGPVTDGYGNERIGLDLETTINRHDFGVSWNADLPNGGSILDDEVVITADLALVQA